MRAILAVVFFLHNVLYTSGECFKESFTCGVVVNLNNKGTNCSVLKWSEFSTCEISQLIISHNNISQTDSPTKPSTIKLSRLDMSFNKLKHLPGDFLLQAEALLELNLMSNMLSELPDNFFNASTQLRILNLEGNPLTSVPYTIVNTRLEHLTVDCRCDITRSIMGIFKLPCQNITSSDCKSHFFKCKSQSDLLDLEDFYTENCGSSGLLALYVCAPLVIVAVLTGVAVYLSVRKKRKATDLQNKSDSRMSPAHMQPRYTSRNAESHSKGDSNQSQNHTKAYENVFVGQLQATPIGQYECLDRGQKDPRRSHIADEDCYMECDTHEGDQPIYGNTHPTYYNYTGSSNKADDDVYILPDT